VIATGFRDQMPERRARMLNVEEAPVVSVPVVAPQNWLREPGAAPAVEPVAASAVAPSPVRFMSQDDDEEDVIPKAEDAFFFSSSTPAVATMVSVEVPPAKTAEAAMKLDPEPATAGVRPQFAEMAEEPSYTPLPRDYTSDLGNGQGAPVAQDGHRSEQALFPEPDEASLRELDTPTFLRRFQF